MATNGAEAKEDKVRLILTVIVPSVDPEDILEIRQGTKDLFSDYEGTKVTVNINDQRMPRKPL